MRTLGVIAVIAFALCSARFDAPQPVKWTLQSSVPRAKMGRKFNLLLTAQIEEGWHLYSMEPMPNGPIPTRIAVPPGAFQAAGAVQASDPIVVFDPTFKMDVELYDTQATFRIPVKTTAGTKPGKHQTAVDVTFQTCNDRICMPPTKVEVTAPVTVIPPHRARGGRGGGPV